MDIKGKVHEIGAVQQVTDSFKKRDLIVEYAENPQFLEYIRFEATQDKVSLFDNLATGDQVEVFFNLRGRPWTNKEGITTYFNSLVAWRVNKVTSNAPSSEPSYQQAPPPNISAAPDDDDLPF